MVIVDHQKFNSTIHAPERLVVLFYQGHTRILNCYISVALNVIFHLLLGSVLKTQSCFSVLLFL